MVHTYVHNCKCTCGKQHDWQLLVSSSTSDPTIRFTGCAGDFDKGWIEISMSDHKKLIRMVKDIPYDVGNKYHIAMNEDSYSGTYIITTISSTGKLIAKYIESPIDLSDGIEDVHCLEALERMGLHGTANTK